MPSIRKATPAHLDAIEEIERLSFDHDRFERRQLLYLITRARGAAYILQTPNRVAGYIILLDHARRDNLRIYSLAVHPQERGHRYAALLLDRAIRYARRRRLTRITLEVKTDNLPAIKTYEKHGFVKTAYLNHYYADDADGFAMQLDLPPERDCAR